MTIILSPDLLLALYEKRKKETRRPAYPEDVIQLGIDNIIVMRNNRVKFRADDLVTVKCKRTGFGVCLLEVTSVAIERIQNITEESAIAEGFQDRAGFEERWRNLYKKGAYAWDNNPYVYRIGIEFSYWVRRSLFDEYLAEYNERATMKLAR